ncbi:hypothetical protein EOD39_21108 [Acipenser ruthenus]|uniref:Uncharacterized protein n=1 Tax=Acipenser ruthenus TaxID=7906 RepID=A0A444UTN4_ACIRT|nr:hypothetical protein EOD39_21108 [Acipenser ruthenus]
MVRRGSSGMRPGRQEEEEEVEGSGSEKQVAGEEKTAEGDGEVAGPSSVNFPLQGENEYDDIAELFDPISMISDLGSTDNREAEELVEQTVKQLEEEMEFTVVEGKGKSKSKRKALEDDGN